MKINIKKFPPYTLFACLLLILAALHFYQRNLLAYTGDEPRLAYYAYSLVKGDLLKYPPTKFSQETHSPSPSHGVVNAPITLNIFNKNMFMMNSIIAPLLYAPALFFGKAYKSWELLRTAAFLYYCGALIFMWLSLKTIFSAKESLLALAITTLSLPQLAQMSLGNTEQAAIFFLAAALYFLIFRKISILSTWLGTTCMCLVVCASMRSTPLIIFIALGFLVRLWTIPAAIYFDKRKILFLFLMTSIIGGMAWVVMQLSFTGTISGSSLLNESLIDKSPIWFLHRLFVPMLNHRDGIFLLFPLVFAALLGLIHAARQHNLVAWVALSAWLAYYFLISLTGQAEGYPGRFQFILVEFFAIGLAFYIRDFRNVAAIGVLLVGIAISSIMVWMHLLLPSILVENREFGLFQQMVLEKTCVLDFGKYVIWDQHSAGSHPSMPLFLEEVWSMSYKVGFFLVILGSLLLASISNRRSIALQRLSTGCALLVMLVGVFSLFVMRVPQQKIAITKSFVAGQGSVKLIFNQPIHGGVTITFGPWPFWFPPEFPSFFSVRVETQNGVVTQYQKRSMPEIRLSKLDNIKSILIKGDKTKSAWNTGPIGIYLAPSIATL